MIRGWKESSERLNNSMRYHVADRRGRIYLCGCAPAFRVGDGVKHPIQRNRKFTGRIGRFGRSIWAKSRA